MILVFIIGTFLVLPHVYAQGELVGDFINLDHQVNGKLYVISPNRVRITEFFYDGLGPDAFFWVGSESDTPSSGGRRIPNELNMLTPLESYSNAEFILDMGSVDIRELKYFSVWCRQFAANFGYVDIPANIRDITPGPHVLPSFSRLAHGVRSGDVVVTDEKTLVINNLFYDGQGPDAFFVVGTGARPVFNDNSRKVADETGSFEKLGEYNDDTITLTLPGDLTIHDIDWISIYCITYAHDFGNVLIPDNLDVPTYIPPEQLPPMTLPSDLMNCMQLHDKMNLMWEVLDDNQITFQLEGAVESGWYLSFGLSGSDSESSMDDADVIVAFYDQNNNPHAVDYRLTSRAQCSNGVGACPDVQTNGVEDLVLLASSNENGVVKFRVQRPLNTGDVNGDKIISTTGSQYVVWAMGRVNDQNNNLVTKHDSGDRLSGNLEVEFGGSHGIQCSALSSGDQPRVEQEAWDPQVIMDPEVTEFTVRIGPSGGDKGYNAITGTPSWGIAWYVNDLLIPEIYVERNVTYTFRILGGDDPNVPADYHPFYISDDPVGGYIQLSDAEREEVTVYAGINAAGNPTSNSKGTFCDLQQTPGNTPERFTTFNEYFSTLTLRCPNNAQPGVLRWTPDANTPDNLYYHCYAHRYLGWKIHVVDEISAAAKSRITYSLLLSVTSLFLLILKWT